MKCNSDDTLRWTHFLKKDNMQDRVQTKAAQKYVKSEKHQYA